MSKNKKSSGFSQLSSAVGQVVAEETVVEQETDVSVEETEVEQEVVVEQEVEVAEEKVEEVKVVAPEKTLSRNLLVAEESINHYFDGLGKSPKTSAANLRNAYRAVLREKSTEGLDMLLKIFRKNRGKLTHLNISQGMVTLPIADSDLCSTLNYIFYCFINQQPHNVDELTLRKLINDDTMVTWFSRKMERINSK